MKHIFSALAAAIGLAGTSSADQHFAVGSADILTPVGWSEVRRENDRLTLQSPDGQQQATISILRFGADPSFDDFKRLCELRLKAEKDEAPDSFVQADPPHKINGKYVLFYSGGEKGTGRVFSGYLNLTKRELVTVYLEGLGVAPRDHLQTFQGLVEGMKRK